MTSNQPMHEAPAAALRRYTSVPEMLGLVAYSEARAIMLAWARVTPRDPLVTCQRIAEHVIEERAGLWHPNPAAFAGHVRGLIRGITASQFFAAARRLGPPPWSAPLAPGQLGDAAGIERIFHDAGELARRAREQDPRVLSAAVALSDFVRALVARKLDLPLPDRR